MKLEPESSPFLQTPESRRLAQFDMGIPEMDAGSKESSIVRTVTKFVR